jgi:PTH1 family peptidyl-tRNA hydrolase
MYIIAGLGNPGKKYENTRHNIGFITLDYLAERHDIKINKIKHKALVGEGRIAGQKVLLVEPQTYMNLSGESLREVMDYYKVDIEDMIVIYDDIDLEAGAVRIRKKGGPGTHNGMRSIVQHLGTDFPRIRMGIGKDRRGDLVDFVLGGFTKEDKEVLEPAIERAALAIEMYISEGIEKAMNKYNIKAKKEKKKKAEEPAPENNENEIKGND